MYQHEAELEQLRCALADIEASRARYFELYDLAPVGYALLDDDGIVIDMNLRATTLLATARGAWNGRNFKFSIVNEDQGIYDQCCKQLLDSALPQVCEVRMYTLKDASFWARLEMSIGQTDGTRIFRIVMVDITDQKTAVSQLRESECQLRHALAEKNTLIQEVHHRVKDNLQVVASLLRMQAEVVNNKIESSVLNESRQRILSMALIHERLYGNEPADRIDFGEYARALIKELFDSYAGSGGLIIPRVTVPRVLLNADQATCCGLILNELVTNALKYAYPDGRHGEVRVALKEDLLGCVTLTVSDKGVGLPPGLDWRNADSVGLPIVDLLAKQIGGKVIVGESPGASFTLEFFREAKSIAAAG